MKPTIWRYSNLFAEGLDRPTPYETFESGVEASVDQE